MATDKTVENEEKVEEETEEEAPEEEATDTETEEETKSEEEEEETEEDQQLLKERLRVAEEKAERYRAERDRLKGTKKQESKPEGQTPAEYDRLYLVASGYKDRREQDEFIDAAKRMGVGIEEASSDEYVLAKIERMRKAQRASGSVSRPSNGSAPVKKDVDYYVRKGTPPTDPQMYDKWEEAMAKRAQGDSF